MALDTYVDERDPAVARWEGQAMHDVGVMIRRYVAERPPPDSTQIATDFEEWAEKLIERGEFELADLGARPLAVVR